MLMRLKNVKTHYFMSRGPVRAVDGVSLSIERGESFGLAGESGSGKSTVAYTIMRLIPAPGRVTEGRILLDDLDILQLSEEEMRGIRWKRISMIFQGAMSSFNPVYRVGDQIVEAIGAHENVVIEEAEERASNLLEMVGLDASRSRSYPHELSGGMRQRALIAMALSCGPDLLVADEPTTALDVITQAQITNLLKSLRQNLSLSVLLITHDLSVISELCEKVAVMYAGKIVESGDVKAVYSKALHPYTQGLIDSFPNLTVSSSRLEAIPGNPPDLLNPPMGCRFHPRCKYAKDICRQREPHQVEVETRHVVSCHIHGG